MKTTSDHETHSKNNNEKPKVDETKKDAAFGKNHFAWGKTAKALQAGLAMRPAQRIPTRSGKR